MKKIMFAAVFASILLIVHGRQMISTSGDYAHTSLSDPGIVLRHGGSFMKTQDTEEFGVSRTQRALKQASAPNVTVVNTAQELLDAVDGGASYIEIRSHLDLRTVEPLGTSYMLFLEGWHADVAIWGNCADPLNSEAIDVAGVAPLDTLEPWQCAILTDMTLGSLGTNTWLHNVYIRHHGTTRDIGLSMVLWCSDPECNLWLTKVTVQGDGKQDPFFGGVQVTAGQMYADGLTILDFSNENSALHISDGATVTLKSSTIARTTQQFSIGAPVTLAENPSPPLDSPDQDTVLRLDDVTFSQNTAEYDVSVSGFERTKALMYSDSLTSVVYFTDDGVPAEGWTVSLDKAPKNRPGIDASTAWFVEVQEVLGASLSSSPESTSQPSAPTVEAPTEPSTNSSTSESPETPTDPSTPVTTPQGPTPYSKNTPETPTPAPDDSGDGNSTAAIIGGGAAAVIACLTAIVGVIMYHRRKRRARAAKKANDYGIDGAAAQHTWGPPPDYNPQESQNTADKGQQGMGSAGMYADSKSPTPDVNLHYKADARQAARLSIISASNPSTMTSNMTSGTSTGPYHGGQGLVSTVTASHENGSVASTDGQRSMHGVSQPHAQLGRQQQAQLDTFDMPYTSYVASILGPPGYEATADQKIDFLQQQLDSFDQQTPIFDDLVSLGSSDQDRRQGGQAIVQMAVSKNRRLEYAMKFFLSAAGFNEERGLYQQGNSQDSGSLAQFLPKVLHILPNAEGHLRDMHGHPLPPCIVMERGESLDLWAERSHPDRNQAFTIMHQLANRLRELHSLGYVHRDLKPGNVMWLPRRNRWTIIDFGCVAQTGSSARLGFSLTYGAPEVIAAYRRGDRTMVAQEAVDVWSLGVMAFELLTGSPALSMLEGKDNVMDRIQGLNGMQLPWEGTMPPDVRRQLGIFRSTVLKLLHRDPAERPSMREFCVSCDRVLGGSTTMQSQ